ncbi:hypothetical protein [Phormidium tenue]|uniref:Uncharacterized protein n=1 Tax=Phormidium tenue FACHB-1050 TaxID=2692857 RepID=A0ABR8C7U0_9CYAN|nr:hypothetical protein [Phormidium tenue]MBD2316661.1 hypothetical protein [Phormidium tenue FACHB-1050]
MLQIYSHDRYITTIEPVSYARSQKFKVLFLHLLERLEQHQYEIGEYIAHEGDRLLQEILALHSSTLSLRAIASDYELLQNLFTRDLIELNKFEPCEEAQKDRPHLDIDPAYKRLKFKTSGDPFMDNLADLAVDLGSYDQAISLVNQLTQTQISHFLYRYVERSRPIEQLINEQNKEYFFKEWLADDWNKDYMSKVFNS